MWSGPLQAARFQSVVPEQSRIGFVYKQMGVGMWAGFDVVANEVALKFKLKLK